VRWLPVTQGHQLASTRARRAEVAPSAYGVLVLSALKLNLPEPLLAWGVSKVNVPFACPDCRSAVIAKKGDQVVHHCAHARGSSCPGATRSSIADETAKFAIYQALGAAGLSAKVERPIGDAMSCTGLGESSSLSTYSAWISPGERSCRGPEHTRRADRFFDCCRQPAAATSAARRPAKTAVGCTSTTPMEDGWPSDGRGECRSELHLNQDDEGLLADHDLPRDPVRRRDTQP